MENVAVYLRVSSSSPANRHSTIVPYRLLPPLSFVIIMLLTGDEFVSFVSCVEACATSKSATPRMT
jgi:hypothetical protein